MKQTLTQLKDKAHSNTLIIGDINAPLSVMDSSDTINKETHYNNTTN